MPFDSLREFMAHLEARGALVRVREPVSPVLEITEIHTRLLADKGPAVLFENVEGFSMPVLDQPVRHGRAGGLGHGPRAAPATGAGRDPGLLPPAGAARELRPGLELLPLVKVALAMKPKTVSRAPCQEVVLKGADIDLGRLPIQTCWPGEPAPLITWPLVVTKGPSDAREDKFNLGIYRMQVLGRDRTLMRWLKHRGGAQHHRRWGQSRKDPLPCAVVLGADPGVTLAAVTPVPDTMSEYQFAGLLRGRRVELVDCVTVPIKVPATAEIVLEGHVSLDEFGDEGPYGDHTGYYNAVEPFPVFTVSAITMRKDPIYLSTFTGRPPDEPSVLGEALNDVFVPLLRQQFPEIVDFWLPPEGCSYRVAVVSIRKAYPGHARRIMMGVWSYLRQFMYTKFVIVVDDDIDCRDWNDVIWAISTRVDPGRDLLVVENTPIDYLDFASPESGLGGKLGIDATDKWPPETQREWGTKLRMAEEVVEKVTGKWDRYGLPGAGRPIWK